MEPKVNYEQCIMSFVFNTSYPSFEDELTPILKAKNYKIEPPFKKPQIKHKEGPISIRVRNLKIAERNGCSVVFNPDIPVLFIGGNDWTKIYDEFNHLKEILIEKMGFDLEEMIKSFELVSENKIKTGERPRKMIDNFYQKCDVQAFSDIFNNEGSLFTIRFVPVKKEPNSDNWYEILIEPSGPLHYFERIVYRNKDVEKFLEMANNFDKKIVDVIKIIEG